jgi:hypothetical protein
MLAANRCIGHVGYTMESGEACMSAGAHGGARGIRRAFWPNIATSKIVSSTLLYFALTSFGNRYVNSNYVKEYGSTTVWHRTGNTSYRSRCVYTASSVYPTRSDQNQLDNPDLLHSLSFVNGDWVRAKSGKTFEVVGQSS